MNKNFIERIKVIKANNAILVIAQNNIKNFDDSLFFQNSIHPPECIKNSVIKRRAEYFAGRLCAKKALSFYNYEDFFISNDLSGRPLWPDGINGSISHCNNYAVALLSSNDCYYHIGVDVENIRTHNFSEILKHYALNENEVEILKQAKMCHEKAATLFFSVKESYFKAVSGELTASFSVYDVNINSFDEMNTTGVVHVAPAFNSGNDSLPPLSAHFFFPEDGVVLSYILSD